MGRFSRESERRIGRERMWGSEGESEAGLEKQPHLFDGSRSRNLGFILRELRLFPQVRG